MQNLLACTVDKNPIADMLYTPPGGRCRRLTRAALEVQTLERVCLRLRVHASVE